MLITADQLGELMRGKNARKLAPIHPGTILRDDLEDVGVSINQVGRELWVPVNRISAIVNGRRSITPDTALRLAQYFGNSPQYWVNLQAFYDLEAVDPARRKEIERHVRSLPKELHFRGRIQAILRGARSLLLFAQSTIVKE